MARNPLKSGLSCSNCGGPYFAKGLCEQDLKKQRLGLPLKRQEGLESGPTVVMNNRLEKIVAMVKDSEGRPVEAIPSEGWYTSSQLEREAIKAAESKGVDLGNNKSIVFRTRKN